MTVRAAFYCHTDPEIRDAQTQARHAALRLVADGHIRWGTPSENAIQDGFVTANGGRVEEAYGVQILIALHELRAAKRITVNKLTGRVRLFTKEINDHR